MPGVIGCISYGARSQVERRDTERLFPSSPSPCTQGAQLINFLGRGPGTARFDGAHRSLSLSKGMLHMMREFGY